MPLRKEWYVVSDAVDTRTKYANFLKSQQLNMAMVATPDAMRDDSEYVKGRNTVRNIIIVLVLIMGRFLFLSCGRHT